MASRYKNGDRRCGFCGDWVKKKDIPMRTKLSKTGILLCNVCGLPLGMKPNVSNVETINRFKQTHRTPIKFKSSGLIKDILANKEKWEKLTSTKNLA